MRSRPPTYSQAYTHLPTVVVMDNNNSLSPTSTQLPWVHDESRCPVIRPDNVQSPPFPRSPTLLPVSPRGFSNISSLDCSLEVAQTQHVSSSSSSPVASSSKLPQLPSPTALHRPESSLHHSCSSLVEQESNDVADVHAETQALMQMLSLVGSRFFEADHNGFPSDEEDHVADGSKDESAGPAKLSSSCHQDRYRAIRRDKVWPFLKADFNDEHATPKGGQTPMAASSTSLSSKNKSATSPFGVHSEFIPSRPPPYPLPKLENLGAVHPQPAGFDQQSDAGGDGDSEDSFDQPCTQPCTQPKTNVSEMVINATSQDAEKSKLLAPALDASSTREQSSDRPLGHLSEKVEPQADVHKQPSEGQGENEQLISRLRLIFDLEPTEELLLAQPCWLFRSILLQGYLYFTSGHLCFYAYLPSREEKMIRSGHLAKLTRRTHRFSKHWATLKGSVLSWFDSERDPYFPQGHIDLRKVSSIEPSSRHSDRFKVNTSFRRFTFQVDSEQNRNAWITTLRKELFRAQNEGESVKVSIPLETIIDVDITLSVDQTEMVCIKVVDQDADFAVDEYFFLHLSKRDTFLSTITQLVVHHAGQLSGAAKAQDSRSFSRLSIRDSTSGMQNTVTLSTPLDHVPSVPMPPSLRRNRLSVESLDKARSIELARPSNSTSEQDVNHQGAISIPHVSEMVASGGRSEGNDALSSTPRENVSSRLSMDSTHTYPPSTSSTDPPPSFEQAQREIERGWAVPKWLKETPSKMLGHGPAADAIASMMGAEPRRQHRKIVESWSKDPEKDLFNEGSDAAFISSEASHREDMTNSAHSNFSVLDAPDENEPSYSDSLFEAQYRDTFGLPDSERLLGHVHASLYRVLPVAGRMFVSTNHLAFRSSGLASKTIGRTLMLIPLADIISVARHQAFRISQHGLVITVRGHEELFLEFPSMQQREELFALTDRQLDSVRDEKESLAGRKEVEDEKSNALILTDLSDRIDGGLDSLSVESSMLSAHASELGRSNSFSRSDASALISFRPKEPLLFTMLTIGSRGDVQPYIALAKGLQADGHRVRIATHGEFGDWVQGHGIDFREIGGDPAELMRICVENGTFTVSFLRESVTKFRGWLDDLLESCWEACQGTDVIIESPSAIAGLHVAEALQVPYFRAFTMPWTRTRAYPHAFAVPNKKAGGNYNYMSYVIFDQMFWRASAGQINRWRKKTLNLQPTSIDKLEQHKVPFIYNFSPSLVHKPLDWFEWIHVTGFWFLDNPDNSSDKQWQPPSDLVAFIKRARDHNRKLVYIGWGSIVVSDAEAMTRCVLQAVQKSGVCAILSKGWSDRLSPSGSKSSTAGQPSVDALVMQDVFQVSSVPHDWLFPQIDAACHHGGAGTLGASLRAGLPTVVKPYFGDQFFWGQQVESLGVGSCVRKLTADNLAAALVTATTNVKQIERAKKLGAQIHAEDGVGNAIKAIYRDLDYARSRIKLNTRLPPPPSTKNTCSLSQPQKDPSTEPTGLHENVSALSASNSSPSPTVLEQAPQLSLTTQHLAILPSSDVSIANTEANVSVVSRDNSVDSAGYISEEWCDISAPWSPSMSSSQEHPSI